MTGKPRATFIGHTVEVLSTMVRTEYVDPKTFREEIRWYSKQLPEPRIGIITGIARRYDGIHHAAYSSQDWDAEPAYLEKTKCNWGYLVRFGATNKEVFVMPEACLLCGYRIAIPYRAYNHAVSAQYREFLRDAASHAKRDNKGRFLKSR